MSNPTIELGIEPLAARVVELPPDEPGVRWAVLITYPHTDLSPDVLVKRSRAEAEAKVIEIRRDDAGVYDAPRVFLVSIPMPQTGGVR